jgi:hypothetical protein
LERILVILSEGDLEEKKQQSFLKIRLQVLRRKFYYIGNTFALVALVLGRLSCNFHGGYHADIVGLVPGKL